MPLHIHPLLTLKPDLLSPQVRTVGDKHSETRDADHTSPTLTLQPHPTTPPRLPSQPPLHYSLTPSTFHSSPPPSLLTPTFVLFPRQVCTAEDQYYSTLDGECTDCPPSYRPSIVVAVVVGTALLLAMGYRTCKRYASGRAISYRAYKRSATGRAMCYRAFNRSLPVEPCPTAHRRGTLPVEPYPTAHSKGTYAAVRAISHRAYKRYATGRGVSCRAFKR